MHMADQQALFDHALRSDWPMSVAVKLHAEGSAFEFLIPVHYSSEGHLALEEIHEFKPLE